jgi:hypothetical protein
MSGGKPGLLAVALSAWLGTVAASTATAQGVVPGGWASEFSYQSFGTPGAGIGSGYGGFGYGNPGAGFSPYGMTTGFGPFGPGAGVRPFSPASTYTPSAQTVNAINPLIDTIRRSTRRKGGG